MALTVRYSGKQNGLIATLETMDGEETGAAIDVSGFPDKTVQAAGTFGGVTLTVKGSNDGSNWVTLTTPAGDPATLTAAGMLVIAEAPVFVRFETAGGAGTDIDVIMLASR